jgi:hypothetical protein
MSAASRLAYDINTKGDSFMQVALAGQPEGVPLNFDVFQANVINYAGTV